ncbi:amidohydrolase family protein [Nocardia sp. CNY236]|uniref:N-acyl-D-amino-acid deacylase family protein n=1 Tax=Nocardia sp. CNY236 TaxID=1169152 RepID=UPI0004222F87|nr:amidohydrolase family protein [Nocardia sp. CNY236]
MQREEEDPMTYPIRGATLQTDRARPSRRRLLQGSAFAALGTALLPTIAACAGTEQTTPPSDHRVDILISGGQVYDGAGNPWVRRDIGIIGDKITFVGRADIAGVVGKETIDATGLVVTPGFIDMHSHADPDEPDSRTMLPQRYQGITTVVVGVDGWGRDTVSEDFTRYRQNGMGANLVTYVGFNAARKAVMGMSDQPATREQIAAMQDYIERGMRGGAFGMSSGLFYTPGVYAGTDEVIEVATVSGRYHGIYDTHDRDLGAVYEGIGFLASIAEAIEIGEKSGNRVIFSHFSPQSVRNYGRAPEGAALIERARARGVDVMAAQHPYTATMTDLKSYALPSWALAGGKDALLGRYRDPATRMRMQRDSEQMLDIRGGAGKIVFVEPDPELNGRSLQQVADRWDVSPFEVVIRMMRRQFELTVVMNMDLYDIDNIRYLATQDWMMTCTDGISAPPGPGRSHPRSFGAFTNKLRRLALDERRVTLPHVIRGMTGLAATFLGLRERGYIQEGFYADINVIDLAKLRDNATYEDPQRYSDGMVEVLVNGQFALRDGQATETLAGVPIARTDS